jgi:hypothetical protein
MPENEGKLVEVDERFRTDKIFLDAMYSAKKPTDSAGEWFSRTL